MKRCFAVFLLLVLCTNLHAQDNEKEDGVDLSSILSLFKGISFSGQYFLAYQTGKENGEKYNEFLLKRGYVTIKKNFRDNFSARITQDISVDREGDGEGDVEIRLKYGFLKYDFDDFFILTEPSIMFGLVPRPWLSFEQKVNFYRVQGPMFLDRNDILSSADYGVTVSSLIGGEIDNDYQKEVTSQYPGLFGSLSFGVYNGGGYHAIEKNNNKIFEGRLTVRPLPYLIPGLQLSYFGVYGKGNSEFSPNFFIDGGFLSFENKFFTLTGTAFLGEGNQSGSAIDPDMRSADIKGYSLFGEIKIIPIDVNLIGRYDFMKTDFATSPIENESLILGISYNFLPKCKLLIDYDRSKFSNSDFKPDEILELAIELNY